MYEGNNNIICKDIIEKHWLEFLGAIKKERDEQKKQAERRRKEILKSYVDGKDQLVGGGLVSCDTATEAMGHYYYPDLSQFWNWYIDNKLGE